jgi:hypothetical protein
MSSPIAEAGWTTTDPCLVFASSVVLLSDLTVQGVMSASATSNASCPPSKSAKAGLVPRKCSSPCIHTSSAKSIGLEHLYTMGTPRSMKRKQQYQQDEIDKLRKKLKLNQQSKRRLKKKVRSMQDVIAKLKSQQMLSDGSSEVLQSCFADAPLQLFKRMSSKSRSGGKQAKTKYELVLRSFALTLHFYSPKAYNYVRETFDLCLPHPSTIRLWLEGVNGAPGFTSEAFEVLRQHADKSQSNNQKVFCSLIIDEMSIRQHMQYDGKRMWGHINMGTDLSDSDTLPLAREALVFIVVTLTASWKIPVAYFLINSLSGSDRAGLVQQCIEKLYDVGVQVVAVVCDGTACNITMFHKLGACVSPDAMNCSFYHPSDQSLQVFAILDACHMLKLVRNALATYKKIKDDRGDIVDWGFFEQLHELQQLQGLHVANRLRAAHINYERQKMKVSLAAQTLSASVGNALQFCRETLKLPEFADSLPTERFVRKFDRLFDILNSKNAFGKGYKAPLKPSNEKSWLPFLVETAQYIRNLQTIDGVSILSSGRKTGFLGFLLDIGSIISLYNNIVQSGPLCYLLTYKMSQDHIELFFSAIRARGGFNNNPTARQFAAAYTRLLVRHEVKVSTGNCIPLDSVPVLHVTNRRPKVDSEDVLSLVRKFDLAERSHPLATDHDYDDVPNFIGLTLYEENVVTYIAGFVVRKMVKRITCEECKEALYVRERPTHSRYDLVALKNNGGLIYVSEDVADLCNVAEKCVKRWKKATGDNPSTALSIGKALCCAAFSDAIDRHLFSSLDEHMFNCEVDDNHVGHLIRTVYFI